MYFDLCIFLILTYVFIHSFHDMYLLSMYLFIYLALWGESLGTPLGVRNGLHPASLTASRAAAVASSSRANAETILSKSMSRVRAYFQGVIDFKRLMNFTEGSCTLGNSPKRMTTPRLSKQTEKRLFVCVWFAALLMVRKIIEIRRPLHARGTKAASLGLVALLTISGHCYSAIRLCFYVFRRPKYPQICTRNSRTHEALQHKKSLHFQACFQG